MDIMNLFAILGGAVAMNALLSALVSFVQLKTQDRRLMVRQEMSLQEDVTRVLRVLEENSQHAAKIMATLQGEVAARARAVQDIEVQLKELQQRRTLLELTPEQRMAIESLVHRPRSSREILTSKEFWIGRMLPSTFFFLLGFLTSALLK